MNGKDLLLGMKHTDPKFIEEAETATLGAAAGRPRLRLSLVLAATIALLVFMLGCALVIPLTSAEEPWISIPKLSPGAVEDGDVHLRVLSADASGVHLECSIDGFENTTIPEKSITLLQNAPFTLEKQVNGAWEPLSRLQEDPNWDTTEMLTAGYMDWYVHWSTTYGMLESGTYRFTTVVLEDHAPLSVEFTIEADTGLAAAAQDLLARDCYHLRHSERFAYGSLENVPAEDRDYFTKEPGIYTYEFWKSGDDYLILDYRNGELMGGLMLKDGVKYKLTHEQESNDTPIAGWESFPSLDVNRLTFWAQLLTGWTDGETRYAPDGSLQSVTHQTARTPSTASM